MAKPKAEFDDFEFVANGFDWFPNARDDPNMVDFQVLRFPSLYAIFFLSLCAHKIYLRQLTQLYSILPFSTFYFD